MPRPRLLLPLAFALGALAVPAAADASFQARIQSDHVSIVGTDADEAVFISASGQLLAHSLTTPDFAGKFDFDSSLPGTQTVESTAENPVLLIVDAEGGDDFVGLDTPIAELSADGSEGDDQLTGAGGRDRLLGGPGDDFVTGGADRDTVFLGEGDDRYTWLGPQDGQDTVRGNGGEDEMIMAGTTAADTFGMASNGEVVRTGLNGTGALRFVEAERLRIIAHAGDDRIDGQALPAGVRLITDGGPDTDEARGGRGDDLLAAETVTGGDGDDRMLVRAPTQTFTTDGGEGLDVTHVTGASAADAISLRPQAPHVRIEGSLGGTALSEAVLVDAFRGDDNVTVFSGTGALSAIVLDGGPGNDLLRGSEGVETLDGSFGLDVLDGGGGPDRLLGGRDDDVIRARDGVADAVGCGDGEDLVLADLGGLDTLADGAACEQVQPGTAAAAVPLARVFGATGLTLATSKVEVPVACSAGARGGCDGFVDLVTAEPLAIGVAEAPPVPVRLGSAPFSLAPGASGAFVVAVPLDTPLLRVQGELGRPLQVYAQVRTELAEHATELPMHVPE